MPDASRRSRISMGCYCWSTLANPGLQRNLQEPTSTRPPTSVSKAVPFFSFQIPSTGVPVASVFITPNGRGRPPTPPQEAPEGHARPDALRSFASTTYSLARGGSDPRSFGLSEKTSWTGT
uniref:Uncharacterized protein n=1 Tax=Bionectria ochroleuca TaxID=29856 RepID=A0A8H7NP70_BIOOC